MRPALSRTSNGMTSETPAPTEASPSQSHASDFPRATLGGYRLLRKLGSGGMADVYLGQRLDPSGRQQIAAIKVMRPQLAQDQQSRSMFFDEARVTWAIRHPSVCRVLDFGVDEDVPYLATEYVVGEMLSDLIEAVHRRPHGQSTASALTAYIVAQACEGLHAAHEASDEEGKPLNIIHRDIAPQNIMVGYDGHVRVLDFGIARSADQQHETQHGVLRGRFAYMSPEQMEGGLLDRRADVWSLGVILWEGATGRRLFKRESVSETVRAVVTDSVVPMLRSATEIPLPLLDIVERAVVRNPVHRYPTARKMADDLSALTTTGPSQVQAVMRRVFEARFEAKKHLLGNAMSSPHFIMSSGTGYRSVSSHPKTESGMRITAGAEAEPPPRTITTSGAHLVARQTTTGEQEARPSTLPPTGENPKAGFDAHASRPSKRLQKVATAALVAASVALGLVALDSLGSKSPSSPEGHGVLEKTVQAATPAQSTKAAANIEFGEVVVKKAGATATVRVDGTIVGVTPTRLALTEGPHLVEVWSGPPALPVIMPIHVRRGEQQTLSVPDGPQTPTGTGSGE